MHGWAVWYRQSSQENNQTARGFFERALEIDGRSSDAMTGLATVLAGDIVSGFSTSPDADKARAEPLIRQALELDPNSAAAHYARGLLLRAQNRLAEALDAFGTAIALNRNNAGAISEMGIALTYLGRPEEAIPLDEKALRLDPRSRNLAGYLWALGYTHLMLGHVHEAIALLRPARCANPRVYYVHMSLAGASRLRADIHEAKRELAYSPKLN